MRKEVVMAEFLLHPESGHLLGENEEDVTPPRSKNVPTLPQCRAQALLPHPTSPNTTSTLCGPKELRLIFFKSKTHEEDTHTHTHTPFFNSK